MIGRDIANSFVDFIAACRDAWTHRSSARMSEVYQGWEWERVEQEESHMTHLHFRFVPRITDANTKSANDNSRLRRVLTCWK